MDPPTGSAPADKVLVSRKRLVPVREFPDECLTVTGKGASRVVYRFCVACVNHELHARKIRGPR